MNGFKVRLLAILACLACLVCQSVWAGISVKLLQPDKGVYQGNTPIRIALSGSVQGSLVLELDDVDISALAHLENTVLIARPPKILKPGLHTVRLFVETKEGDFFELGYWRFSVSQSSSFDQLQMRWQGSAMLNRQVDVEPSASGMEWGREGGVSASVQAIRGEWRAEGRTDIGYISPAVGGDELALSDYLLRFRRKALTFSVGHQSMLAENFLSDNLSHRGVQLNLHTPFDLPLEARLFTGRADSIDTFQHTLGVDDAANQVVGGSVRFAPLSQYASFQMQTDVYQGRVTDATTGWEQSGSGWTLVLSDRLSSGLSWRGEVASSNWDADGRGRLASNREDQAWRINADYKYTLNAWQWLFTADYGRIGPYFVSLLNPTQQQDQEGGRLAAAFTRGNWQGAIQWQRVQDNVAHDANLLTTQVEDQRAQLGYQFDTFWVGLVSGLNFSLYRQLRQPKRIPVGYTGTVTDDRVDGFSVQADLKGNGFSGQISWDRSWLDDVAVRSNGSDTQQWQLSLQHRWKLGQKHTLSVAPSWQWGETVYRRSGQRVHNETFTLDLASSGWQQGRLQMTMSSALGRDQDLSSSIDTETYTLSSSVDYRLRAPASLPVSIGVSGDWQRLYDRIFNTTTETWQLYATLRIQWD